MRLFAAFLGSITLAIVLIDAFNTIVLARRTRHIFRIARLYYKALWEPFAAIGRRIRSSRRREAFLAVFAPLSLLLLFMIWALALVFAFGLLQWAAGLQKAGEVQSLGEDFLVSASALFSLGTGNAANTISRWITALEGGLGLAFLGLVVGYLPVFYQSFSSREITISLLDARAGSPPSSAALLSAICLGERQIAHHLEAWEQWGSAVLENHLSYPMLAYFRSHHANQSWLTALVAITDCAAVMAICTHGEGRRQAEFTLAMARHVLSDMTALFSLEKGYQAHRQEREQRLVPADITALVKILSGNPQFDVSLLTEHRLREQSALYESQAYALGDYFLMTLPAWLPIKGSRSDWRAPVTDREDIPLSVSDPFAAIPADHPLNSGRYEVEREPLPRSGRRR